MLPQYPPLPHNPQTRPQGNGYSTPTSEARTLTSPSISKIIGPDEKPGDQMLSSGPPSQLLRRNTYTPNGSRAPIDDTTVSPARPRSESESKGAPVKKRPRRPSIIQLDPGSPNGRAGSSSGKKNKFSAAPESPPAVLVREKKQKACSNCRRAKLKCIVEDGDGDCVRCKARKEKCVFYPRSHDEDWQQMLTSDVYSALNHLSTLSSAVHHILHHLSAQRIIPPLPTPGFEIYEPPSRDISSMQGWNADRNRELGDDNRRKRRPERDDDDEGSHPTHSSGWTPHQPDTPFLHRAMSGPIDRPPWTPVIPPPFQHDGPYLPQPGMHQPPLPYPHPSPGVMGHRPPLPDIPPLRHSPARPINLSPTVELTSYPHGPFSNSPPYPGAPDIRMAPPPPPQQGPGSGSGPGSAPRDLSPLLPQNATPNSLINSSPSGGQQGNGEPPWPFGGTQQGDQNPFSGSMDNSSSMSMFNSTNGMDHSSTQFEDLPTIPNVGSDDEVYGSADGRETIITKKIIPAPCVKTLVEYFHSHMSPFLFGYHLQLRAFPYLPEGPTHITPFILAVECLLAAERIPNLYSYHDRLADAVLNMLMTSPAESWQTIQGSREIREAKAKEQVLGKAFDGDTTDWDAELGIGPEEIVAACTLATFIGQKEHARHIAQYAFMWARGWTAYLKEPGATFAEATGLVTPLRRPSEPDMARVWLLCFIVSGQETLQATDLEIPQIHDPMRWARVLLPETKAPDSAINPYDVLLVFHARLIALLLDWQKSRIEIQRPDAAQAQFDPPPSPSYAHKRLASRTNASLDWWQDDLKAYRLDVLWMRQIQLDYLNAKVLVNSVACKNIWGGPDEDRLREANRAFAVDAAYQLLRRCMAWTPQDAVTNLPQVYLRMLALAASEVVEALADVQNGNLSRSACSVTAKEVVPVLAQIGNMLFLGGLPTSHGCRTAGHVLRQHVENLNRLAMN